MKLTMRELAEDLRVSVETLNRYKKAGKLPHHKIGDRIFIYEDDYFNFLNSCKVEAPNMPTMREARSITKALEQRAESKKVDKAS